MEGCDSCPGVLAGLTPSAPALLKEAAEDLGLGNSWDPRARRFLSAFGPEVAVAPWLPSHVPPASAPGLPFERSGKYRSLGEIGRGGMGVVYRARQIGVGRDVAVKVLPVHARNSVESVIRLKAEATRLGQIVHPNIVRVYDADEHDGLPYFSMELVEGQTLSRTIRREPPTPGAAAALVRVIAEAVHEAHLAGVIHCDLKPGNVLMTAGSVPKVTDFGLATSLAPNGFSHRPGEGTAEYMAPEQWLPGPEGFGPWTDVYGLGSILYEMLTGRPPIRWVEPIEEVRRQVLLLTPAEPRALRPGVSRDLQAVCLKCLAKAPENRYQSARELADDLGRYRDRRPVNARPRGVASRAGYFVRRHGALTAVAALTVVALAMAFAQVSSVRKDQRLSEAKSTFKDGDRLATNGQVDAGVDQMRRAVEVLPDGPSEWRSYFLRSVAAWEGRRLRTVRTLSHVDQVTAATVSHDGRKALVGDASGGVTLWDLVDGTARRFPKLKTWASAVAFNRGGTLCATGDRVSGVIVWDVALGEPVSECSQSGLAVRALAFLDDGRRFVTGTNGVVPLKYWEATPGTATRIPLEAENEGMVVRLIPSPDGTRFVSVTSPLGVCRLWDAKAGRRLADLSGKVSPGVTAAAFSSDGTRLALAVAEEGVSVVDGWSGATQLRRAAPAGYSVDDLGFRKDGHLLLLVRGENGRSLRHATPDLASFDEVVSDSPDEPLRLGLTVNHDRLLCGVNSNALRVCRLPAVDPRPVDLGKNVGYVRGAFSKDGSRVAVLSLPRFGPENLPAAGDAKLEPFSRAEVKLWDCRVSPPAARPARLPDDFRAWAVALSGGGDALAVGSLITGKDSTRGSELLYGTFAAGGGITFRCLGSHPTQLLAMAFAPNGRRLVTGSAPGSARLANRPSAEVACWDPATGLAWRYPYPTGVLAVAVSPDNAHVAVGGNDGSVRVGTLAGPSFSGERGDVGGPVTALAYSHDGRTLVAATRSGRACVFRVEPSGLAAGRILDHGGAAVTSLAFDASGTVLLAGTSDKDGRGVRCWDARVWEPFGPFLPVADGVSALAHTADRSAVSIVTSMGRLITRSLPGE